MLLRFYFFASVRISKILLCCRCKKLIPVSLPHKRTQIARLIPDLNQSFSSPIIITAGSLLQLPISSLPMHGIDAWRKMFFSPPSTPCPPHMTSADIGKSSQRNLPALTQERLDRKGPKWFNVMSLSLDSPITRNTNNQQPVKLGLLIRC